MPSVALPSVRTSRPVPLSRSIEADGSLGTPIMGRGSYPDVDAAAKVGRLLQDEGAAG